MTKRDVEERQVEFEWALKHAGPLMRAMAGIPQKQEVIHVKDVPAPPHWKLYKPSDIEKALDALGIEYVFKEEFGTNRLGWAIRNRCLFSDAHTDGCYVSIGNGRPGAICHHSTCEGKSWKDVEDLLFPDENPAKKRMLEQRVVIYSMGDALMPQPPVDWVVHELNVAGSTNLLYGEPGTKKTHVGLVKAVCIATGTPFLGRDVKQGPVLIVDEESGRTRMNRWLREIWLGLGLTETPPLWYITMNGFDLADGRGESRELLRSVVQTVQPVYCLVDALADMMTGSEDKKEFTHPVFQFLRKLGEEFGPAWDVLHHAVKNASTYRGSTAIHGAVDSMTQIKSGIQDSYVEMRVLKSRDGEPQKYAADAVWGEDDNGETVFTLEERPLKSVDVAGQQGIALSAKQSFLYNFIASQGGCHFVALEDAWIKAGHNTSDRALRVAMDQLVKKNLVRKTSGTWADASWDVADSSRDDDDD